MNLGEAAHIKAAREGQARYDPKMTDEERSIISNGIWLCKECARKIDLDEKKYAVELLHRWKEEHEKWLLNNQNNSPFGASKEEQEKRTLIFQMASPERALSREAVRALRNKGWLRDGTLTGANLSNANLKDEDLSFANLEGANLSNANLEGANLHMANLAKTNLWQANLKNAQGLTDDQLSTAYSLLGATMSSGKRYNGRFNLDGDLVTAHLMRIGKSDEVMAAFYEVSVEDYQWGQEWKRFRESPPAMYGPVKILERWSMVMENPDGLSNNSVAS